MNGMDFQFSNSLALHSLWLVAGLAALLGWAVLRRRTLMQRWGAESLIARIAPGFSLARPALRAALCIGALVSIVLALSDPRWGTELVQTARKGADVVFVVDVSRSMLGEDATPNRLERAKQFVADAIDNMAGDRVALVDFAGTAAVRVPLTLNYSAFKTALNELEPKESLRGGSLLGDAIARAADCFIDDQPQGKAIVVLTDGEDMESEPAEAAGAALAEHGIRVFTVGIGDSGEGARIPIDSAQGRTYQTHQGQEVWSKMDPQTLEAVATAGGGLFVNAGLAQIELGEILERSLADLDRQSLETAEIQHTIPRFQWPVAAAIVLLIAESLTRDRRAAQPRLVVSQ